MTASTAEGGVKSMSLKCPTCRRKVTLDARGLASLPRNFLLENIVARYKEESAKAGKKARTKPVMCQVNRTGFSRRTNIVCLKTCYTNVLFVCQTFRLFVTPLVCLNLYRRLLPWNKVAELNVNLCWLGYLGPVRNVLFVKFVFNGLQVFFQSISGV